MSDRPKMSVTFLDGAQRERFYELRREAEDRVDCDYLRYDQFLVLMMDVYEHHLECNPGPLVERVRVVDDDLGRLGSTGIVLGDGEGGSA